MFGDGREDMTMKQVVLTALGCVLSFVVCVVCNPFAAWLLPVGTYFGDFRALLPNSNIFNSATILLTPSILFAYSFFVGQICQDDKERKILRNFLVLGCFAGFIYLMISSVNKILESVNYNSISGEFGFIPLIFVMGTLGVVVAILYLGFMGGLLLSNVGVIVLGSYVTYDERKRFNYKGVAAVFFIFLSFCTVFTHGLFPLADAQKTTISAKTEMMYKHWTTRSDSSRQYIYTMQHIENGCIVEYIKETSSNGQSLCLWRRVYDKNKKLIAENNYTVQTIGNDFDEIKNLRNQSVIHQMLRYHHKEISLKDLVEWAHYFLLDGSTVENDSSIIMYAVGRIGLADLQEFRLSEKTIKELTARLVPTVQ